MGKYRVLLVNPYIHDFAAYDFWLKPLGLLYVGAFLRSAGVEVTLIDLLNRHDPDVKRYTKVPKDKYYGTGKFYSTFIEKPSILDFVPRKFKRYGASLEYFFDRLRGLGGVDAVFVTSTMTYWYTGVWETIRIIKDFLKVPVVLGGIYPQLMPEHAERSPADFVFKSNDLNNLPEFLKKNLGWSISSQIEDWFEELDPDYSLYKKVGYLVFTSSLGCPFRCTYCITPKMWGFKRRSPSKVVVSIERYVELFGVKDVAFFDDAFLVGRDYVMEFLNLLVKSERLKSVRFHLPNGIHARLIDEDIAFMLKKANFKTIKIGYETKGELQLKTGGKVLDSDIERAVEYLRKAGFTHREVSAYILANLPGQNVDEVIESIDFVVSLGISFNINEYTPIPGTSEWFYLVKKGIIPENVDPILLNNTILPFWWKGGLNREEIEYIKDYAKRVKEGLKEKTERL